MNRVEQARVEAMIGALLEALDVVTDEVGGTNVELVLATANLAMRFALLVNDGDIEKARSGLQEIIDDFFEQAKAIPLAVRAGEDLQ